MKKIVVLVAALGLVAGAVFAADPAPAPAPVGVTVGTELAVKGINSGNKLTLGLNYTVDYDHSIDAFEFEIYAKRATDITPSANGFLYSEVDLYYHIGLSKEVTFTPWISFQDDLYFSRTSSVTSDFAYAPALQFDFNLGSVAPYFLVQDAIYTGLYDGADDKPQHDLFVKAGVKVSGFNIYVQPDFYLWKVGDDGHQASTFRLDNIEVKVSKSVTDTVGVYFKGVIGGFTDNFGKAADKVPAAITGGVTVAF